MQPTRSEHTWWRTQCVVAGLLLTALLAACAPSTTGPAPVRGTPGSAQAEIHPICRGNDFVVPMTDQALREAVMSGLDKPAGTASDIRCSDMARVTKLNAQGVESLAGLEYAINLSSLTLRNSPVTSLAPLEGLSRLQSVVINEGRLTSLESVARIPALIALDVANSSVTDLSPLASLPALAYLKADRNAIADISVLEDLTELAWVDLSHNQITDVSAFSQGHKVQTLLLNDNLIRDAGPLGGVTELKRIELANNELTDLGFLRNLEPRSVNLSGNRITSVTAVAHNSYLDGSRTVDLRNNCIDLESDDPFVQDVLARGGRILLEPQSDFCLL